ncbi:MAG: adenosylcobinamide-GDP ribazoletransferase, partial [Cytophagales bacterium]|nr:adenosylcobinamide-GDP ribazoletransferase [Cytophagales bacterium]
MDDHQANRNTKHLNGFYLAIGFFTRLPTRFLDHVADEDMGRALVYLPVVGLVLGLLTVGSGLLLSSVLDNWHNGINTVQLAMTGVVCFVVLVSASGGLHLDGLADCADAWVGGLGDQERTLKILKDPLCGAMAVTVLILTLLLKAAGVIGLVMTGNWLLLLLVPVLSRSSGLVLFLTTEYVRPKGLGQAFADFCSDPKHRTECRLAVMVGLVIPAFMVFLMSSAWPGLIGALAVWFWTRAQSRERLGGITGDACGALIEMIEAVLFI